MHAPADALIVIKLDNGLSLDRSVSSALRADEVIGIDLGTTNSCVAVMEGKVRLPNAI